ncbi:sulfatase [Bacteroidota bacterium]
MKKSITIALSLISLMACNDVRQSSGGKPNVLFIAIDDLNSCLEGMNGETTVHTPNINSLVNRGVLFTNAHCAAPACNPSRTSVMTGLAPSTSGVYYNWQDWRENQKLKDWITLPHHFQNAGYKTLGGGKIYHAYTFNEQAYAGHIDPRPWDEYFPSKSRQMPEEVRPDSFPVNGNKEFYNGYFDWAAMDIEPEEMADAKVVSWAEQQLSRKHEKPLFLAVGIYRPHVPWYTPKSYFKKHPLDEVILPETIENDLGDVPAAGQKMANRNWQKWMVENNKWEEAVQAYNASVSFADDMVGRLLVALDKGPMAENTIIVLWTDHGYHLGQKEHWEKFALWEQTTRVPMIIAAPGKFKAGKSCNQAVSLLDLYPTLVELWGGTQLSEQLDGVSLVPLLVNPEEKTGRSVVCTQGFNNHAVRSEKWRYIRYADGSEELYNHEKDPKEFNNLAGIEEYYSVKEDLAAWLPEHNANLDPKEIYNNK